jgi:exodeoxyribonuclease VII small subunit
MNFEVKLKRLEEIVGEMESGDLPLEKSLKLFEEGVKLSRECNERLQKAELEVKVLLGVDADGEAVEGDFLPEKD